MNKKYIKRLVVLDELNFPIDKDIKKMIDMFENSIYVKGRFDKTIYDANEFRYMYKGIELFAHIPTTESVYIFDLEIMRNFEKIDLQYKVCKLLLGNLLERQFKIKISNLYLVNVY